MKDYVLDTNAVIRYLRIGGGSGGDRVKALFDQAKLGSANLYMSAVNLGEVFYIMLRRVSEEAARQRLQAVQESVIVVGVDTASAVEAAALKHRYKLGYADSFAAALALERNATLVSADPGFERYGRALKWLRLPPFEG